MNRGSNPCRGASTVQSITSKVSRACQSLRTTSRRQQRGIEWRCERAQLAATRADRKYWLENMAAHHYAAAEAGSVLGEIAPLPQAASSMSGRPYPGGRPLRMGFRERAINPLRGTKASVFLPWAPKDDVVIDLPEAIFNNLGLLFLAHTHIPTIWNEQNKIIENVDWERFPEGGLRSRWKLPNDVSFGAGIAPQQEEVRMELWLENGTSQPLSGLRTQICVLLKGVTGFETQTNDNKTFGDRAPAAVGSSPEWERCGRTWGNALCPCLHSGPVLPDCAPGQTVRLAGRLSFREGEGAPVSL